MTALSQFTRAINQENYVQLCGILQALSPVDDAMNHLQARGISVGAALVLIMQLYSDLMMNADSRKSYAPPTAC